MTKLLYFVNVVGQLFLLNAILATEYKIYGIEVSVFVVHVRVRGGDFIRPRASASRAAYTDMSHPAVIVVVVDCTKSPTQLKKCGRAAFDAATAPLFGSRGPMASTLQAHG